MTRAIGVLFFTLLLAVFPRKAVSSCPQLLYPISVAKDDQVDGIDRVTSRVFNGFIASAEPDFDPANFRVVTDESHSIIATLEYLPATQGEPAQIYSVAVAPEYRGQGLGKALIERALQESTSSLYLLTEIPAFYEPFGFEILLKAQEPAQLPTRAELKFPDHFGFWMVHRKPPSPFTRHEGIIVPHFPHLRPLRPTDRSLLQSLFNEDRFSGWIYNATELVTYVPSESRLSITEFNGALLLLRHYNVDKVGVLRPLNASANQGTQILRELASRPEWKGTRLVFEALPRAMAESLAIGPEFTSFPRQDLDTYFYHSEDLARLPGKDFLSQRNHINHFERTYAGRFRVVDLREEPVYLQQLPHVLELWEQQKGFSTEAELKEAQIGRRNLLHITQHFSDLNLFGIAVLVDDQIVSFSLASKKDSKTLTVGEQKGSRDKRGSFAMAMRAIARVAIDQGFEYVDLQADAGFQGLRALKQSYHPFHIEPWWNVSVSTDGEK